LVKQTVGHGGVQKRTYDASMDKVIVALKVFAGDKGGDNLALPSGGEAQIPRVRMIGPTEQTMVVTV
jgi:hypothetical protein